MPREDELVVTLESNAFPCDALRVSAVSGTEAVSRLFDFELTVVCLAHEGPDPDAMLGARATIVLERFPGAGGGWHGARRISGVIAEVDDLLAAHADLRAYRLRLVPRAFALTLVETQDIFLRLSVPEIIRAKIEAVDLGASTELRLAGSYAKRELVAQYKETDQALVSRLAEHLGISFYFLEGEDGDRLIFTDHRAGFTPIDAPIAYRPGGEGRDIYALSARRRLTPAYCAVRDYNYRAPLVDITGEREVEDGFAGGVIEFGAHHKTPEEAAALAAVRAEEHRAWQLVYTGQSAVPALFAGARATIADHPDLGSLDVLVTEVTHRATQIVAGVSTSDEPGYVNTFRAIPADRMYRPPRVTPKPRISGLVTGIVDGGPGGSQAKYAHLDEHGRYLIRFLFDTTPRGDQPTSHRVRMIQNHAGENYGTHFPLKPGVEVVIAFIDGDPDRPLIVGAVPNPIKPSPVTNEGPGVHRIRTSSGITVDMVE